MKMDLGVKGKVIESRDKMLSHPLRHVGMAGLLLTHLNKLSEPTSNQTMKDMRIAHIVRPDTGIITRDPGKYMNGVTRVMKHFYSNTSILRDGHALANTYNAQLKGIRLDDADTFTADVNALGKVLKGGRFESLSSDLKVLAGYDTKANFFIQRVYTPIYEGYGLNPDPWAIRFLEQPGFWGAPKPEPGAHIATYSGDGVVPVLNKAQISTILKAYIDSNAFVRNKVAIADREKPYVHDIDSRKLYRCFIPNMEYKKYGPNIRHRLFYSSVINGNINHPLWKTFSSYVAMMTYMRAQSQSGLGSATDDIELYEVMYSWALKSMSILSGDVSLESLGLPASFKW